MAESETHIKYVRQAERFVIGILPKEVCPHLKVDSPSSNDIPPQLLSDAYRPDLYLHYKDWHIIGEAKTDDDCARSHSIEQYKTYFNELESFGLANSLLIVSCSMIVSPTVSNLLLRMKKQYSYQSKVLVVNELGKYKEF